MIDLQKIATIIAKIIVVFAPANCSKELASADIYDLMCEGLNLSFSRDDIFYALNDVDCRKSFINKFKLQVDSRRYTKSGLRQYVYIFKNFSSCKRSEEATKVMELSYSILEDLTKRNASRNVKINYFSLTIK